MTGFRVRVGEGQKPDVSLLWDSLFDNTTGEANWALASPTETSNRGGLAVTRTLETAVILCLFTDRRVPDDHPLRKWAGDDPRGWWGDGIDIDATYFERPLGSLLWLLEHAALADVTSLGGLFIAQWAELFARDALQVLIDQGAVARIDVAAIEYPASNRLGLAIDLFGQDGTKIYSRKFSDLWTPYR